MIRRNNGVGLRNVRMCINYLQRIFYCRSLRDLSKKIKISYKTVWRWYSGSYKVSRRMAIKLSSLTNGKFSVQFLCPDKKAINIQSHPKTKRFFDILRYKLKCKNYTELANIIGISVQALYYYTSHKRIIPYQVARRMIELSEDEFNIFELLPYLLEGDTRP